MPKPKREREENESVRIAARLMVVVRRLAEQNRRTYTGQLDTIISEWLEMQTGAETEKGGKDNGTANEITTGTGR